jgi:GNAT superfamily N-acetyltransferase
MRLGGNDLTIRRWERSDEPALLPAILDCLAVNFEAGADMRPTERNAKALCALGMLAAERGEPCLVVVHRYVENGILGYTLWCELPNPLGLDFRGRVLHGLGTYVKPEARKLGVSHFLRNEAERQAQVLGFTKVVGVAYHDAGLQSVLARGYRPCGTQVEKVL